MFSTLARFHSNTRLLLQAARGAVLLVIDWAMAVPARIFVGAAISALVVGVGGNAIFTQDERHRSALAAPANPEASVAPVNAASAVDFEKAGGPAPALTGAPAASSASLPVSAATSPRAPAVPISVPKAAAAAVPAVTHGWGSVSPRAAPPMRPGSQGRHEVQSAARASDPIGDLLHGILSGSGLSAARQ